MQCYYDTKPTPRATRRRFGSRWLYVAEYNRKNPPVLGVELEAEFGSGYASWADDPTATQCTPLSGLVQQLPGTHLTFDGSLIHGRELVLPPATLEAWTRLRPVIELALRRAHRQGWHADRDKSCGMHVHLSKSAFANKEHAFRLVQFLINNQPQVRALARRDNSEFASFQYNDGIGDNEAACRRMVANWWAGQVNFRYKMYAVAFNHRNTAEFRIFQGTLTWLQFARAIQFCASTVAYTRLAWEPSWAGYRGWVRQHKTDYPELARYLRKA